MHTIDTTIATSYKELTVLREYHLHHMFMTVLTLGFRTSWLLGYTHSRKQKFEVPLLTIPKADS